MKNIELQVTGRHPEFDHKQRMNRLNRVLGALQITQKDNHISVLNDQKGVLEVFHAKGFRKANMKDIRRAWCLIGNESEDKVVFILNK